MIKSPHHRPTPPHPGQLKGYTLQQQYQLDARIGEGGMAFVYKATHNVLGGTVAVKILKETYANNKDFRERFLREARLQYQINHTHIVRVLDFITDDHIVGSVLEWCDGGEIQIKALRQQTTFPLQAIQDKFLPLLDAMAHIHQKGLVHRDLKPQNILVSTQANHTIWKINDFGLLKDPAAEELTQSGAVLGTFHYISPEQLQESKVVDHRADIYSLGVILYQLLLGCVAFPSRMPRVGLQIVGSPVPYPNHLPTPLKHVLQRCLAKQPQDRWESCHHFKDALSIALADCIASQSTAELPPPTKPSPQLSQVFHTEESNPHPTPISQGPPTPSQPTHATPSAMTTILSSPQHANTLVLASMGIALLFGTVSLLVYFSLNTPSRDSQPLPYMLSTDKQTHLNERKKHRAQELLQLALRHAKSGNWGQTRYYLKSKCKHTKRHCYWYGRWIHNSLRILKQACQSGDSVGCYWSSAVTKRGHTPAYFFKRAAPFYRQACKQGDSRGCIALAKAARLPPRTKQTSKDYLESSQHQWLKRACQLRSPRGCLLLGRFRQTHLGKMYRETALASYRKACQLYEPVGCIEWGQLLRSLPALRHKAKQAFAMACRQHMPQGCKLAKQTTHAR